MHPLIDAHTDLYDEVWPHVLFGDLSRFVIDAFYDSPTAAGTSESENTARQIPAIFERAIGSDDDRVRELVSVSFLEKLRDAEFRGELVALGGPTPEKRDRSSSPRASMRLDSRCRGRQNFVGRACR